MHKELNFNCITTTNSNPTRMCSKTLMNSENDFSAAVQLWDTTTSEHIRTLTGHLSNITCVAFSPDGKTLASNCKDGTVLLWDLE